MIFAENSMALFFVAGSTNGPGTERYRYEMVLRKNG